LTILGLVRPKTRLLDRLFFFLFLGLGLLSPPLALNLFPGVLPFKICDWFLGDTFLQYQHHGVLLMFFDGLGHGFFLDVLFFSKSDCVVLCLRARVNLLNVVCPLTCLIPFFFWMSSPGSLPPFAFWRLVLGDQIQLQ